MTGWDRWKLSKMASRADAGWFYYDIGNGASILVHPDKDCTRIDCPQHGIVHRHLPALEQWEQMYDCVTDWLRAEFDAEEESRFEQESIAECYRIIAMDDPRDPRRDELKCISLRARLHSMSRRVARS